MTVITMVTFIILFLFVCVTIIWAAEFMSETVDIQTEVQKRIADAQERSAEATEKLNALIISLSGPRSR